MNFVYKSLMKNILPNLIYVLKWNSALVTQKLNYCLPEFRHLGDHFITKIHNSLVLKVNSEVR